MQSTGSPTDIELIQRVAKQDAHALRILFDRYGGFAHAIAWQVLGDHQLSEDAVQDTFVSVWRKASQFKKQRGQNVRAWILAIANNRAIDIARSRSGAHKRPSSIHDLEHVLSATDAFAHIDSVELRELVREAMQQLTPEQGRAIELNVIEGYSHREIGEMLDTPVGTIKRRIRIGMQRLYDVLSESGEEW